MLGGRPLIAYTIDAAQKSNRIDRVVVSTEDEEIAAVASSLGAEVPFMRPSSLAQNKTPMLPVISHAIETLSEAGWAPDVVCVLQPTFPFRDARHIDACVDTLHAKRADSVISVHRVPHEFNPHWVYFREVDGSLRISTGELEPISRRQDLPPAFHRSGAVYVCRAGIIRDSGSFYGKRVIGCETPADSACNLDTMTDWAEAEALVKHWRVDAAD
jgi:CMP-N-acetylneuraminic acid synthetase